MNILMVSERYHPSIGGVESQARLLAYELARNHRVEVAATRFANRRPSGAEFARQLLTGKETLLTPGYRTYSDGPIGVHAVTLSILERAFVRTIRVRGTPVPGHYFRENWRRFGYSLYRAAYVPKLRTIIRGRDVVHSFASDYFGWAAQEAARAEGVPYILSTYVHPGQWGDDAANVAHYKRSDAVLVLLETDRKKLIDLGVAPELIRVSGVVPILPDVADPKGFRARHGLGVNPVVLFIGRIEEYKGVLALLDSADRVWSTIPSVHFVFAGPAREDVRPWFDERRDNRIRYLGAISDQEKADAMAACDLFCMPSRHEVLPAVYLEAWSYGKPVIGGTAYGLPELIEHNQAGLALEQDPDLIASSIIELLLNESRRQEMGWNGRNLVERRFSKSALVRILETAYDELSSANREKEATRTPLSEPDWAKQKNRIARTNSVD